MQEGSNKPLIVIVGPTASGKSALAVALARHLRGEVVSADSRQVYRGLDVGTEKITVREMRGVPHHCISIVSPRRPFSVAQWHTHARRSVERCHRKGVVPILAGGTGLYVDTLVFGTRFPTVPPNQTLRRTLGKLPTATLHELLTTLDPTRARAVDPANPRRLVRAIEIAHALGSVPAPTRDTPLYRTTWIGVRPPFPVLEERIAKRVDRALRKGLVAETRALHESLGLSWRRIHELGLEYRICALHISGELPRAALYDTLVRSVRRYAKRQCTWLNRYSGVAWYESADEALRGYLAAHANDMEATRSHP